MAVRWRCFLSPNKRNKTRLAQGGQNLQMMLMSRFYKFQISKTVNYHMQASEGASRTRQDKIGRRLNPGRWTKIMCHDKFSNIDSLVFYELCHLTARRFN